MTSKLKLRPKSKETTVLIIRASQSIPEHLSNIFPSHGEYIANILKFCGYQSRETIVKLRDKDEVKKMFTFAATYCDLIDKNNRRKTFGIFARNPQTVTVLPGLKPVLKRFITAVENLIPKKSPISKAGSSQGKLRAEHQEQLKQLNQQNQRQRRRSNRRTHPLTASVNVCENG